MAVSWVQRAWTSPTLTTWGSFAARSLNLVLVLPLALVRLSAPEIQIWQVVLVIGSLVLFLDLGLSPTFTRMFARSVSKVEGTDRAAGTDFVKVEEIWQTMFFLYRWAAAAGCLLLFALGTPALWKAIHALDDAAIGWYALAVVGLTSPLSLLGLGYGAYLQGLNHVALGRRWEALASLGATLTSLAVLAAGAGALAMVIANQFWVVLAVVRNRMLARQVEGGRARGFAQPRLVQSTWMEAWPAVWRSGLGVLLTTGFIQATGLIYAQVGNAAQVASYMVALRYLTAVSQFSQAPFYSKLPTLARLQAAGAISELVALARRGMRLSHGTYAVGMVALAFALPPLLNKLDSEVPFVPAPVWWLLAFGTFFERFGAMHIQLFSTTNRILWHIVSGISGTIMITVTFLLLRPFGVYAFPIGILSGYIGFYAWFSARLSYREFHIRPLPFEAASSLPAFGFLCAGAVVHALI